MAASDQKQIFPLPWTLSILLGRFPSRITRLHQIVFSNRATENPLVGCDQRHVLDARRRCDDAISRIARESPAGNRCVKAAISSTLLAGSRSPSTSFSMRFFHGTHGFDTVRRDQPRQFNQAYRGNSQAVLSCENGESQRLRARDSFREVDRSSKPQRVCPAGSLEHVPVFPRKYGFDQIVRVTIDLHHSFKSADKVV